MKKSESKKKTSASGDGAPGTPAAMTPPGIDANAGKAAADAQTATVPELEADAQDVHQSGTGPEKSSPTVLEAIGAQIVATHAATKGAFVDGLLSASKCGLLLIAAKSALKVGTFEVWFDQRKFDFTKVTRCKYMRLAERLCEEAESKPGLLLSIQTGTDGLPVSFTFDELRLRTVINAVSDGRSLSELYIDWDITKRLETSGDSKDAKLDDTKRTGSPKAVFSRWSGVVEALPKIFSRLDPKEQDQVVSQLKSLLAELQANRQE